MSALSAFVEIKLTRKSHSPKHCNGSRCIFLEINETCNTAVHIWGNPTRNY